MTVKDLEDKGRPKIKRVSRPRAAKVKIFPRGERKDFSRAVVNANAMSAPVTCSLVPYAPAFNSLSQPHQLATLAPSPIAHELLDAATTFPIATYRSTAAAACSTCPGCPVPDTHYVGIAAATRNVGLDVWPPTRPTSPPPVTAISHIRHKYEYRSPSPLTYPRIPLGDRDISIFFTFLH
jgi:hypothetical protein